MLIAVLVAPAARHSHFSAVSETWCMPMWDTGGHTAAAFPWNLLAKACRTVPSVFRSSAPSAAAAGRRFPQELLRLYEKGISFQLGQCCQCFFCQRQHSKYQPCPQQPAPVRSLFRSTESPCSQGQGKDRDHLSELPQSLYQTELSNVRIHSGIQAGTAVSGI